MKNSLIPVFTGNINNEQSQLVDARLLHQFLDVKSNFRDWINNRIKEYQFLENIDFVLIAKNLAINKRGGDRRSKDYHLTIDMAKELSMVERTEKGREARRYFIECERRLKDIVSGVTINAEQQYEIQKAVNEKSFETGIHYGTIYTMLHDEFRIPRYEELLSKYFDKAIVFIKSIGRAIGKKSNIANAPENLNASRAFALALMTNGARRYDEIARAYGVLLKSLNIATDNLSTVIDQIGDVKKMIHHIDHNDGAVHDGFNEARIYLFMDKEIKETAKPIAEKGNII